MTAAATAEVVELTKRCTKCGETRPLSDFVREARRKAGFMARCKTCVNSARKVWMKTRVALVDSRYKSVDPATPKTCTRCGETKATALFRKDRSYLDARSNWCNECHKVEDKKRYRKHLHHRRAQARTGMLKYKYGLSEIAFDLLREQQGNRCAICEAGFKARGDICIDHNHTTGATRGLLCRTCNFALGLFRESPYILESAQSYLKKYEG